MNLWRQFQRATAQGGPRTIGEVTAVNSTFGDHRCTVTLIPGGSSIEVTGAGRALEVGQRWLIQDGAIIGDAPAGSVFNVDI